MGVVKIGTCSKCYYKNRLLIRDLCIHCDEAPKRNFELEADLLMEPHTFNIKDSTINDYESRFLISRLELGVDIIKGLLKAVDNGSHAMIDDAAMRAEGYLNTHVTEIEITNRYDDTAPSSSQPELF